MFSTKPIKIPRAASGRETPRPTSVISQSVVPNLWDNHKFDDHIFAMSLPAHMESERPAIHTSASLPSTKPEVKVSVVQEDVSAEEVSFQSCDSDEEMHFDLNDDQELLDFECDYNPSMWSKSADSKAKNSTSYSGQTKNGKKPEDSGHFVKAGIK